MREFNFERIGEYAKNVNEIMWQSYREQLGELNARIEFALRFMIAHPIKGEITKGKLKWRGIKQKILKTNDGSVFEDGLFIGRTMRITCEMKYVLIQRGKVIDLNFPPDVMERYLQWKQLNTASMKADYQFY